MQIPQSNFDIGSESTGNYTTIRNSRSTVLRLESPSYIRNSSRRKIRETIENSRHRNKQGSFRASHRQSSMVQNKKTSCTDLHNCQNDLEYKLSKLEKVKDGPQVRRSQGRTSSQLNTKLAHIDQSPSLGSKKSLRTKTSYGSLMSPSRSCASRDNPYSSGNSRRKRSIRPRQKYHSVDQEPRINRNISVGSSVKREAENVSFRLKLSPRDSTPQPTIMEQYKTVSHLPFTDAIDDRFQDMMYTTEKQIMARTQGKDMPWVRRRRSSLIRIHTSFIDHELQRNVLY